LSSHAVACSPPRPRRWHALAVGAVALVLLGHVATEPPAEHDPARAVTDLPTHMRDRRAGETRERFDQAVLMLHAKQYEHAITALQRVLSLSPRLPEAHVNLGFAWLGLKDAERARRAFEAAIELRPEQANAYYGLAMALESGGDLPGALGAMRSYLHLSRADDAHRARARAALWEWEERLGRRPPPKPGPRAASR
jgi:Flp pilus assembly protein TadD